MDGLEAASRERAVTAIVHLAALQVPFCAADPLAGARVNVVGTVAIFELARRLGIRRVTCASSAAVYGPKTDYPHATLRAEAFFRPTTHYDVFKDANEQDAGIWWETQGIASIGLRPHSVYGPGRDQVITSKPTVAMIAAAAGRPYRVNFGGRSQFQFVDDAARACLAAARSLSHGAAVYSPPGPRVGVDQVIETTGRLQPASEGAITCDDVPLPSPRRSTGARSRVPLGAQARTPLEDGVRETIETYRRAIRGVVDGAWLDRVLGA